MVLFRKHSIAAWDIFTYICRGLKKPDDMTPKAFKTCFKVLVKLYYYLKAGFELIIGEKKWPLLFFNSFPAEHQSVAMK